MFKLGSDCSSTISIAYAGKGGTTTGGGTTGGGATEAITSISKVKLLTTYRLISTVNTKLYVPTSESSIEYT